MSVLAGQSRTSGFGQLRVVIVCETGGGGQGQLRKCGEVGTLSNALERCKKREAVRAPLPATTARMCSHCAETLRSSLLKRIVASPHQKQQWLCPASHPPAFGQACGFAHQHQHRHHSTTFVCLCLSSIAPPVLGAGRLCAFALFCHVFLDARPAPRQGS